MNRVAIASAVVTVAVALAGCEPAVNSAVSSPADVPPSTAPVAAPGSCHVKPGDDGAQPIPDGECTPGVPNPQVTDDNIDQTICWSRWISEIRFSTSDTDGLKVQQIAAYGYADTNPAHYREDHLIPVELGGAPSDPRNIWPQPNGSANLKDRVDDELHQAVCAHRITLAAAQQALVADWTTAEDRLESGHA